MAASIYLTKQDLKANIHTEYLDLITRSDDNIVNEQIHAAIDYAKSKLSRYDLPKLFGVEATSTAPTINSPALKKAVRDMSVFNIAGLSNANYDLAVLNQLNDNAMKWLSDIQKGNAVPDGWPLRDTTEDTYAEGNEVSAFYNEKRSNRI